MNRRKFLKNSGLGSAGALVTGAAMASQPVQDKLPEWNYPHPKTLEELKNEEGHIALRLAMQPGQGLRMQQVQGSFNVKKAGVNRSKAYFLETGQFDSRKNEFDVLLASHQTVVLAFWLENATENTEVQIEIAGESLKTTLAELLAAGEKQLQHEQFTATLNPLPCKETGELDPAAVNIQPTGDNFSFLAFADPQGGQAADADKLNTRMKIHNAFIEESVALANQLELQPAFSVVIGDVCDHQGAEKDLLQMNRFLGKLKTPVLYTIGNHETRYRCNFEPAYRMEDFNNYFAAQKAMNGMEKLLYSFNLGQWHFVAWPDPLRSNFWQTHPHYFDWLERDLEKHKDRPVMFFQHVPVQPIGINPLINYAEPVEVKRQLIEILARHGNVKWVLSGHVHIPVKASFKTAVAHKGINFVNLPAAGYRPRNFGEEDFYGGPSEGFAIVEIEGKEARVTFKTITEEEYPYPATLPPLDTEKHPLWLGHKHELPAAEKLVNGSFENGLKGWAHRFVYTEDEDPANRCETRNVFRDNSLSALYLMIRRRGYQAPGQDRLPQWNNQVSQAVRVRPAQRPAVKFAWQLDGDNTDLQGLNGGYVSVEGFHKHVKLFNMVYSAHHYWNEIGGRYELFREVEPVLFDLPLGQGWQQVQLNVATDFEQHDPEGRQFADLNTDRLCVNAGVWHINDGAARPFALYLDDFALTTDSGTGSTAQGKTLQRKTDEKMWWRGKYHPNGHLAGEHHYHWEMPLRFGKEES